MSTAPLVLERIYNAPIGKVWAAISNLEHMKKWYFDLDEFKPEVGFEFKFFGDKKNSKYPTSAKVTIAQPNKVLAYTWSFDDYPAETTITWELFAEGDKTRLKLTHAGIEKIPGDAKEYKLESFNQGWTSFMNKLENYLK